MKIVLEMTLDEKDTPLYTLRAASLLAGLAQALRDEAHGRGSTVSRVGQGVTFGTESLLHTEIDHGDSQGH